MKRKYIWKRRKQRGETVSNAKNITVSIFCYTGAQSKYSLFHFININISVSCNGNIIMGKHNLSDMFQKNLLNQKHTSADSLLKQQGNQ